MSEGADDATIAFYNDAAGAYADWSTPKRPDRWLIAFMEGLAPGASVLDLGCGGGWAAGVMAGRNFAVETTDASAKLAEEVRRRYGLPVRVAKFEELDAVARYDGVWASFSLLHMPKRAMPDVLARIHRALRAGGKLYVGLKAGEGETRDGIGRFYAYYTAEEITLLLRDAGFGGVEVQEKMGESYDGQSEVGLHIYAARHG